MPLRKSQMANAYHHACSSVKKWGGVPADYQKIHAWFDESKKMWADPRHRALRHHSEGIFMCEEIFGPAIKISTGRMVPTRWVGEQHVTEDCGFIPSIADWYCNIKLQKWMGQPPVKLEDELEESA